MGRIVDLFRELLAKLAHLVGLKPNEVEKMRVKVTASLAECDRNAATLADGLEAIKERIRVLENRALKLRKEHELARGDTKRIVLGEIERTFREIERHHQQSRIVEGSLNRNSIYRSKLIESRLVLDNPVSVDDIEDLAVDLEEGYADLRDADKAAAELEGVAYESPEHGSVSEEERIAAVDKRAKTQVELSEELKRKYQELEPDVE